MEKKNIAGYLAGLASMLGGTFIGVRGVVGLLVEAQGIASASTALAISTVLLPYLLATVGGIALIAVGGKSIINTFRGNRKTNLINDVKDIKNEVKSLREELSKGIEKTPIESVGVKSKQKEEYER